MIIEKTGLGLLIVVSACLLIPLVRAALRQRAMQAWPQVTGFVVAHHVRLTEQQVAFPEHEVRYQAAGRELVSRCGARNLAGHTNYSDSTTSGRRVQRAVQRLLDRHPVGSTIRVMVNPAHPAEAYLVERELPLMAIAVVVTAILLGFIWATLSMINRG
jgi:Protein of unknown function (DUF3592)